MRLKSDKITVIKESAEKAYHRNGVYGEGFCVVTFDAVVEGSLYPMVAVVFKEKHKVAVFDRKKLGAGVIEFGLNSWRCEDFEKELREIVGEW